MAAPKETKSKDTKKKDGKQFQRWKLYKIEGGKAVRSNKFCPKCGQGNFLAQHKDRLSCGKCNYTEFVKK